jgi:uncharacterized protein YgiM (DUF1202 family)
MRYHHPKALILSVLLGLASATSAYGTPGERFHIKEDNTNIYKSPAATAPVVERLNEGDRVIEFRRQGSWVKISRLGAVGQDGWVERSNLIPEPQAKQQSAREARRTAQVAVPIEASPNVRPDRFRPGEAITPDKIRPGEAITPDTIRPGKCPAFDAATIDRCSSGSGSVLEYPGCVDVPRKPRTHLTLTGSRFSLPSGSERYTAFSVGVGKGRATLGGTGSRECRVSIRVTRSQAHRCRREILLSGAWNALCGPMFRH